jgi:group I intron endonuclease
MLFKSFNFYFLINLSVLEAYNHIYTLISINTKLLKEFYNLIFIFSLVYLSTSPIWLINFQVILLSYDPMFLFSVSQTIEASNIFILFSSTVPIKIYLNADLEKEKIILENKNKAGVYQFINLLTGNSYVGSSINLSRRFGQYFNINYISSSVNRKSVINSSILKNGYSNFSLTILEYCEIKDTINRENFYISVISPTMNILQVAGSSLGFKHSEETKAKISLANTGEKNSMFGIYLTGEKNSMFGKTHSIETLDKMSIAKGTAIYVYDTQGSLVYTFSSARKAAEFFDCSYPTILKFAKNGLFFKKEWILSTIKYS